MKSSLDLGLCFICSLVKMSISFDVSFMVLKFLKLCGDCYLMRNVLDRFDQVDVSSVLEEPPNGQPTPDPSPTSDKKCIVDGTAFGRFALNS